ncbi:MAG: NADH-quinone oxidoreductase subunit N [Phycisphaeraceae bacterium]
MIQDTVEKFSTLWPEIALLVGAVACLVAGLLPSASARRSTPWVAGGAIVLAGLLSVWMVPFTGPPASDLGLGSMIMYLKWAVLGIGLILLLVAAGVPERLRRNVEAEAGGQFSPGTVYRGEFFAFFLFSLTGVMLTAGANDLVWLFLALELTSLPTYVMVATARDASKAQESAVKYFFLGALAAAVFLYGFTLIYGATGTTDFGQIRAYLTEADQPSTLLVLGLVLSVLGICFKIAAFPMHFYAADVYEGATTPVTAFLAFVPKVAGFAALILLLSLVGWPLPPVLAGLLWAIAAITMTLGNVLALLQNNVKRVLAYSSVAHSGYILVGLLAGPAIQGGAAGRLNNGIAAVLFYLVAYGLGTVAAFAVLACLTARNEEAETFDDISGLARRHPGLAGVMVVAVLSLLGLPPLIGFLGKIYLFVPALQTGYTSYLVLVVIGVVNSAISAAYYLRIASVCFFGQPAPEVRILPARGRMLGATLAALAAIGFGVQGSGLADYAAKASPGARRPGVEEMERMGIEPPGARLDDAGDPEQELSRLDPPRTTG